MNKWDDRFLKLATVIGNWSKDPSTKVGAVIVNDDNKIISTGYNGFPRGIRDDDRLDNRAQKYDLIVHAEANSTGEVSLLTACWDLLSFMSLA